ncbi:hypothetical protein K7X08_009315 [Anisodus acutangulus]|uniref:Nop domain-containing protein n=1 Tax=Anisodus acutangulus TaxID=402998 RepID=A0A9Q1MZ99_9SOLA|nr:hypothetical protein K7X08_009315 [Anisodus acutangulus]
MAIRADGKVLVDDLDNVSKLQKSRRYIDIIQKVEDALNENVKSKGKELESIVPHPIDYARVVNKIGNQMDVDLDGLLPSATTTIGKPLREDALVQACNRALALDSAKKKLVHFVENRMGYIAPNLSAVVGSEVAAKLMGSAGGLSSAKLPCFDVELLGAERKELPGYSSHIYDIRPLGAEGDGYGMLGSSGRSDTMSGLTSSLAITMEQGVKLSNSANQPSGSGTELSETGPFSKI